MFTKEETDAKLNRAARKLRKRLGLAEDERIPVGIILGTGWGDTLKLEDLTEAPLADLPGFKSLGSLAGHARAVVCGCLPERIKLRQRVLALRGRVHLNESFSNPRAPLMVRLQVELLLALGVRTLILTAAVGSLRKEIAVGSVAIVDGFVTLFAPPMPLHTGEFCSPEDKLHPRLRGLAVESAHAVRGLPVIQGGHAMVCGPFFEGRNYDKPHLAASGASVVGMSILPEACVAALYPDAQVLALGHVTNSAFEEHSHETNQVRSKARAKLLGRYLVEILDRLAVLGH